MGETGSTVDSSQKARLDGVGRLVGKGRPDGNGGYSVRETTRRERATIR